MTLPWYVSRAGQTVPMRLLLVFLIILAVPDTFAQAEDLEIWDDRPAESWDRAYPVGNGRLGAMPQGSFPRERVLINEETIWERQRQFGMSPDSFQHLEQVRQLEAVRDYRGADEYFQKHLQNGAIPVRTS